MVEYLFEILQMNSRCRVWPDLRYRLWPRMYRLGIWVNVNVYLFVWINSKSSIEHLIVFL
jgi:hypothetical protein